MNDDEPENPELDVPEEWGVPDEIDSPFAFALTCERHTSEIDDDEGPDPAIASGERITTMEKAKKSKCFSMELVHAANNKNLSEEMQRVLEYNEEVHWHIGTHALTGKWGCLTPTEACTMQFIIERTLRFKKLEERIPQRHFMKGVYWRYTGELIQSPCQVRSHKALERAIAGLQEKGLISVFRNKRFGNTYKVNYQRLQLGCCCHVAKRKVR